jgi:hypothetical protein
MGEQRHARNDPKQRFGAVVQAGINAAQGWNEQALA